MNTNGYNGKPVYLSEYGVLLPDWYRPAVDFSPERVNEFMTASFDFVLNEKDETLGNPADDYRLVQRLSWYSVNDDYRAGTPYSYNGNLFDPRTFERSEMGDNYAAYTRALAPKVDLLPISLQSVSIQKPGSTNVFSVTLSAEIANSGNQNHDQRAMVTFFNGDPLTTGKQIGESLPIAISGCGETAKAEYMWKSVATGTYKIYVQVDSNNSVAESNEENNLLSTEISVTRGTSTSP